MNEIIHETAVGRRLEGIHQVLLIEQEADTDDLYNELVVQLSQARGLVGLLTQLDHEDFEEAPNGALEQMGWTIEEQLDKVSVLAGMLDERVRRNVRAD